MRIVPLPAHVHGMTAPGPDGYNVYLDASQSDQERMKAYQHELEHIRHDDWNSGARSRITNVRFGVTNNITNGISYIVYSY